MSGDIRRLASDNLTHTYLALGGASPDSRIVRRERFVSCTGPIEHPVSNFGIAFSLDPSDARALAELASGRRTFNVYAAVDGTSEDPGIRLAEAGFRQAYRLRMMVCERAGGTPECPLERCLPEERLETADFMVREFFGRSDGPSREAIRFATASAPELDLLHVRVDGTRIAAAMLSRSEGLVGLYNLCVRFESRGSGWGASIVRTILAFAAEEARGVSLQCDPSLESWYRGLGFETVGSVDVYVLERSPDPVIMKSQ